MKSRLQIRDKLLAVTIIAVASASSLIGCGSSPAPTASPDYSCHKITGTTLTPTAANVTPINVGCQYTNEPCVSVTICDPNNPSNCQTINDILLDTGSYGLRIFSCATTLNLPSVTEASTGRAIAEITGFVDGACDWGAVKYANIKIGTGSEVATSVPIQVIDYSYAGVNSTATNLYQCKSLDYSPTQAGFNGILGVGLAAKDCGANCTNPAFVTNSNYFTCASGNCTQSTVTSAQLVTNPVSAMPTNNNGVSLSFPSIALGGATSLLGTLTLGIGTTFNNTPTATHVFVADSLIHFQTNYKTMPTMTTSFIDSGSNTYAFSDTTSVAPVLTACDPSSIAPGFWCPSSRSTMTANQLSATGSGSTAVTFYVANAISEVSSSNANFIFDDLASQGIDSSTFDWGFPFFIGKTVYSSVGTTTSSLGTGPYWAW